MTFSRYSDDSFDAALDVIAPRTQDDDAQEIALEYVVACCGRLPQS